MDISAKVLKVAGDNMFINGYFDDAINYYEKSLEIQENEETLFFMAIAYYKVGVKNKNKKYLLKAEKILRSLKSLNFVDEANYYLMLIYSQLKDLNALKKTIDKCDEELIEKRTVIFTKDSFIAESFKERNKQKILDPVLENIYEFLYPYLTEIYKNDKEKELEVKKRVEDFYKKILKEKKKIKMLQFSLAIIIVALRNEEKAIEFLEKVEKNNNIISKKIVEELPVFTRYVVYEFLKKMGIKFEETYNLELPYIIEKEKELINKAEEGFKNFYLSKDLNALKKLLEELSYYDYEKIFSAIYEQIKMERPVSVYLLQKHFKKFIFHRLRDLKKKLLLFYNKEQVNFMLKALISDLMIQEKDKIEISLHLGI
jgi:hypothetical protein